MFPIIFIDDKEQLKNAFQPNWEIKAHSSEVKWATGQGQREPKYPNSKTSKVAILSPPLK